MARRGQQHPIGISQQLTTTHGYVHQRQRRNIRRVLWVNNVWVKNTARGYRLASGLIRAVSLAYNDQPLWLNVCAYDGRPKTDAQLIDMYEQFGYKPTAVRGIMCRDYSALKS